MLFLWVGERGRGEALTCALNCPGQQLQIRSLDVLPVLPTTGLVQWNLLFFGNPVCKHRKIKCDWHAVFRERMMNWYYEVTKMDTVRIIKKRELKFHCASRIEWVWPCSRAPRLFSSLSLSLFFGNRRLAKIDWFRQEFFPWISPPPPPPPPPPIKVLRKYHKLPTDKSGMQDGSSVGMYYVQLYTLHIVLPGTSSYAQSPLINKIWSKFFDRKSWGQTFRSLVGIYWGVVVGWATFHVELSTLENWCIYHLL